MIICPLEFDRPDPDNPGYGDAEVDYYAWIPYGSDIPNHRLSIRKNLITGEYEIYRHYYEPRTIIGRVEGVGGYIIQTAQDTGLEEVAFKDKDILKAMRYAEAEYDKYHSTAGEKHEPDQLCRHTWDFHAMLCPILREKT